MVERAVGLEVRLEDDGAEVADGGLVVGRVERDLGAEIGRVDDADVVLRGADVAGVLEGDPRVAGLEEHREHLLPELEGLDLLAVDFALLGELLVVEVALLELLAVELVEVLDLVGAEERPGAGGPPCAS